MPFALLPETPELYLQCTSAHRCGHLLPPPDPSSARERWGSKDPSGLSSAASPGKNFGFEWILNLIGCSSLHGSAFRAGTSTAVDRRRLIMNPFFLRGLASSLLISSLVGCKDQAFGFAHALWVPPVVFVKLWP